MRTSLMDLSWRNPSVEQADSDMSAYAHAFDAEENFGQRGHQTVEAFPERKSKG